MIKILFRAFVACLILRQISCDECDTYPDFKERFDPHTCCPIPMLINDKWIDDCRSELVFPEKPGPLHLEMECKMFECVVKKGGGVVDGKPSTLAIKKQMKVILDENPEWENTFNAAVDKCVPEVIAKEDETRKRTSEPPYNVDKNVSTMYGHLVTCIMAHLFTECPVPGGGINSKCVTFRNFVKKCVNEFPPRFMKPLVN